MAESLSDGKQETTVTDLEEKAATNKPTELSASEIIENVSQAVCKVNDSETGFLSKFWRKDQLCYGLFTTNHVLNEEMLSSDQRVRISFMEEAADGNMKETMIREARLGQKFSWHHFLIKALNFSVNTFLWKNM